jgi:hypothetical protein
MTSAHYTDIPTLFTRVAEQLPDVGFVETTVRGLEHGSLTTFQEQKETLLRMVVVCFRRETKTSHFPAMSASSPYRNPNKFL